MVDLDKLEKEIEQALSKQTKESWNDWYATQVAEILSNHHDEFCIKDEENFNYEK